MTKAEIMKAIEDQERIVESMAGDVKFSRGYVQDAIRIVMPLHREQLKILKAMLELIPDAES